MLLSEDKKTVKITDFGVSKQSDDQALQSCVGTAWYMAPEVINDKDGYTSSVKLAVIDAMTHFVCPRLIYIPQDAASSIL